MRIHGEGYLNAINFMGDIYLFSRNWPEEVPVAEMTFNGKENNHAVQQIILLPISFPQQLCSYLVSEVLPDTGQKL